MGAFTHMGLFGKKKKDVPQEAPAAAASDDSLPAPSPSSAPTGQVPVVPPAPVPRPAPAPAPAAKGKKVKKGQVDPAELQQLRAELMDMKARLMAAEQSRAIVESRLAALDATALALSNEQTISTGSSERFAHIESRLDELVALEAKVDELGSRPAPAAIAADGDASANAEAVEALAALQASLQARIDSLAARVDEGGTDQTVLDKLQALEAQVAAAAAAADTALAEAGRAAAQPAEPDAPVVPLFAAAEPATPATDPEVLARLDALTEQVAQLGSLDERAMQIDDLALRVAQIDVLAGQLSQLNARVIAQAEFGAQLGTMRDRITELAQQQGGGVRDDSDITNAIATLSSRIAATEGLAGQLTQLAERVADTDQRGRQTADQVSALEQRVDSVGTELANQISELGRDIDGLAERTADVASGTVSDEVLHALRNGQIKLANEQARYEIAFREDLAALAEHVRRNPPRT